MLLQLFTELENMASASHLLQVHPKDLEAGLEFEDIARKDISVTEK